MITGAMRSTPTDALFSMASLNIPSLYVMIQGEAIKENYKCRFSRYEEIRKLSDSKLGTLGNSEWMLGITVKEHINTKLNTQRSYLFMDRVNNDIETHR